MGIVVHPPSHRAVNCPNKLIRRHRGAPFGEVLYPSTYIALGFFAWKDVNGVPAGVGTTSLDEIEPDEVKPFGQLRDPGFLTINDQSHAPRDTFKGRQGLGGILAADQHGIIGVPMQRGAQFLRVVTLVPQLIKQIQVSVPHLPGLQLRPSVL